jgi:putative transcriptional regulator
MYSRLPECVLHPEPTTTNANNSIKQSLIISEMLNEIVIGASLLQFDAMAEGFESLKGQLLLDSGQLSGSFFHRSVVLVCQHDAEGAFGLVLNRVSDNKVGETVVADLPESLKEQMLFLGGPVQPAVLTFLHSDAFLPNANVISNLNMGHSIDSLMEIGQSFSAAKQVRIFAGYSGWGPGQLDKEMRRKAWITHPASLDYVFQGQPQQLWKTILREKGWQFRLLAEIPDDLAWN